MKLRGWQVANFGTLDNAPVSDLPDGLTVVYGPNEAGKSTLLAFLRGMLFGFTAGSGASQYLAMPGADQGGQIEIESASGRLRVNRLVGSRPAVQVTRPDGRPAGEADLKAEIGSVDDTVYGAVFAFGLGDLQALDNIPASELQDRVLSAAIAGAGRSASQTADALESRAEAMLPARGGVIRSLAQELDTREAELADLGDGAAEYGALTRERAQLEGVVESLGARIEHEREELNRNRLLVQCWPDYEAVREAEQEIARLTAEVEFPADPEGALATVNRNLAAAVARLREFRAAQDATVEAMSRFRVDPALAAVAYEFDALDAGIPEYRLLLDRLDAAHNRIVSANAALAERLESYGPAWTEVRIAADEDFNLPRDEISIWDGRLIAARSIPTQREGELTRMRTRLEEAEHSEAAVRLQIKQLVPPEEPPSREQLAQTRAALKQVRLATAAFRDYEVAAAGREAIVEERHRALNGGGRDEPPAIMPRWIPPLAAGAAVAAGGAAIGRLIVGDTIGTVAFGLLAVTAELVSLGAKAILNRVARQHTQGERAIAVRSLELEDAISARDEGRARLDEQRASVLNLSPAVGLSGLPTVDDLDSADAVADRQETERERWEGLEARLIEIQSRIEVLSASIRAEEEHLAVANAEEEAFIRAWGERQAIFQAPRVLEPARALAFLDALDSDRELLRSRAADEAEIDQVRVAASGWENRARSTLAASGADAALDLEDLISAHPLVAAVMDVRARCEEDRRSRSSLLELQSVQTQRRSEITAAELVVTRVEKERQNLFGSIGVATEDEFQARLAVHRRQLALRATVRELEMRLAARLGHADSTATLRAQLALGGMATWSKAAETASQAIGIATAQRDDAIRRQREIEIGRHNLESFDSPARVLGEIATLRTELGLAIASWRTAMIGAELIRRAMRRLADDRRPAVISDAARMFAKMTLGRYPMIDQDATGGTLLVSEIDGRQKTMTELSRGTAEQLYLALRLGLVLDHARHGNDLPVVMDDVIVNFDEGRADAVVRLLADFSRSHQILLFTSHRWTVEMIRSAAPESRFIELGAGKTAALEQPLPTVT